MAGRFALVACLTLFLAGCAGGTTYLDVPLYEGPRREWAEVARLYGAAGAVIVSVDGEPVPPLVSGGLLAERPTHYSLPPGRRTIVVRRVTLGGRSGDDAPTDTVVHDFEAGTTWTLRTRYSALARSRPFTATVIPYPFD